jgi:predicted O-linked N-acetylglucosamine transferase (SPINDLY family)
VPIVSLKGNRFVSHLGESFLTALGFKDLIVNNYEEYISKVVELASDITKLNQLRANIRQKFAKSVITDNKRFTKNLENAYRRAWRKFCNNS